MHKRRRWLIAGSAVLVFLVAIAGTAFYFTGGYEKWRDERSLAGACEGVLSKDDVRAALGSDRVHAQSGEKLNYIFSNLEKDRITKCVLESRGSGENVVINAGWATRDTDVRWHYAHLFLDEGGYGTVPIGSGWHGSLVFLRDSLQGAVELTCRNQKDKTLLVNFKTVHTGYNQPQLDSQQRADDRAGFARLVTSTAGGLADKYGCDAPLGKTVGSVAPDPVRNPAPLDKSRGICAPVVRLGGGAEQAGAVTASDAPTDPTTPAEDCYLNNAKGYPLYRLTALYGGLAEKGRAESTWSDPAADAEFQERSHRGFGTAQCGDGKSAYYSLTAPYTSLEEGRTVKNPDPQFERAALKAFAEQSAKTHGCHGLRLP
ncbi:hypothetical protein ABZ951_24510 [Streptomyces sp. NPDC046215]|uniref:hypothetical protein n=1 Tax=Streptomyces TaxID=1883 RepID=UPI0031CF9848